MFRLDSYTVTAGGAEQEGTCELTSKRRRNYTSLAAWSKAQSERLQHRFCCFNKQGQVGFCSVVGAHTNTRVN
jgi:hypothetical protein